MIIKIAKDKNKKEAKILFELVADIIKKQKTLTKDQPKVIAKLSFETQQFLATNKI